MRLPLPRALGIFGSIDMNRNDYQSGWDTDQFPNNHAEKALAFYEILRAGGYTTGGTNFDAKLRRQSLDPADLILAHVGGMDTCARALKSAAALLQDGALEAARKARYAGWDTPRPRRCWTAPGKHHRRCAGAGCEPAAPVRAAGTAGEFVEQVCLRGAGAILSASHWPSHSSPTDRGRKGTSSSPAG